MMSFSIRWPVRSEQDRAVSSRTSASAARKTVASHPAITGSNNQPPASSSTSMTLWAAASSRT